MDDNAVSRPLSVENCWNYSLASPGRELNQIFGDLAARVMDGPPGYSDFAFHTGGLPTSPTALATDGILIRKTTSQYNSCYRADLLYMNLGPRKCRELGVFPAS